LSGFRPWIRRGSDAHFERLFNKHAQPLYGFLVMRTGNPATSEELVSETFERAFRKRSSFRPERGSEKAWIYGIALNLWRDQVRRQAVSQKAFRELHDENEPLLFDAGRIEDRDVLNRALSTLSPEEREAVALRYGADLTVAEVAAAIGEPVSTAEGRIYRSLRKLRTHIEQEQQLGSDELVRNSL
jgi:RNA polymerase sigma-70 factor (ECF subfamily)